MMLSANTVHTDAEALQSIVAPPPPIDHGFTLENVVFLRLVHSRIAHLKGVALPAAEAQRLQPTDICVTLHRGAVLTSEGGERRLCVSVDPEAACGLSHEVSVLSLRSFTKSMHRKAHFHLQFPTQICRRNYWPSKVTKSKKQEKVKISFQKHFNDTNFSRVEFTENVLEIPGVPNTNFF